jgi:hypothetical protein
MKGIRLKTLAGFAASGLILIQPRAGAGVVITFDDLPAEPSRSQFATLQSANGGGLTIDGVTFGPGFVVVGDQYVEQFINTGGTQPFAQPHSGNYAVFNTSGADALTLTTTQTLTGAWFGSPNFGNGIGGASQVTVKALGGANTLGSVTLNLSSATMKFMDTSSFSGLAGITGYEIDRTATGNGPYGGMHWVADDFTFGAVQEPTDLGIVGGSALLCFCRMAHHRS